MKRKMTREEGKSFLQRWEGVRQWQIRELCAMSPKEKFLDFLSLNSHVKFPFPLEKEIGENLAIWDRWSRLIQSTNHD